MDTLEQKWREAVSNFCLDEVLLRKGWKMLKEAYSSSGRYYHTFTHLTAFLEAAAPFWHLVGDKDSFIMAVFYHDAVYNSLKQNNEVKSAELADAELRKLGVGEQWIRQTTHLILATERHILTPDIDNLDGQLFLDCDLMILGTAPEAYHTYCQQIRKEYGWYPDFVYNPGRRKVLERFLQRENLFFLPEFKVKYETQARKNLLDELDKIL
jgi:predicted metal-dependent HD superfamily phosphohydrolase